MSVNSHMPTAHPPSREVVLDAAQRLLHLHGYGGLSMRELAKHSGLAKGTIYHHFQDKREILLSVLEREFAIVHQTLVEAATTEGAWQTRLRAIINAYFAVSSERGVIILTALRESGEFEAQICDLMRRQRATMLKPVLCVLEEGVAQGDLRPLDLEMTVMSLFGMLHLFAAHQVLHTDIRLDANVGDHVLDIFLNGIVHKPDNSPTSTPQPHVAN